MFRQPGFLTRDECLVVRQAMDDGTVEEAEVLKDGIHHRPLVRNASLVEPGEPVIELVESRLERCRDLIGNALRQALGDREGAGFIRYPSGGFYRAHRDRGTNAQWPDAARRAASVVIFLNSARHGAQEGEFDGGLLKLFLPEGDVDVRPEAGLLVAFPSDLPHEVTEVHGGLRDTIVDWFYFVAPR
jgi:predicted 2-oxoglutarate/Fe(II)-dependent dioxygenase YbiX